MPSNADRISRIIKKEMYMLALYGHPFSSYTWKAKIALYTAELDFDFLILDEDHPENAEAIMLAGPQGKFPVLRDGENLLFETTSIIEYINTHHCGGSDLFVPSDPDAAIGVRMIDRVFDNYVSGPVQDIVKEYIRAPENPDMTRIEEARTRLERTYAWLEGWLQFYPSMDEATLIECAAAPALFYADWVHPMSDMFPRLKHWRAHLLSIPAVAVCVDEARPYRNLFPLGAPDRD